MKKFFFFLFAALLTFNAFALGESGDLVFVEGIGMLTPEEAASYLPSDTEFTLMHEDDISELSLESAAALPSSSDIMLLSNVPTSGSAYSDPVLVKVDYAPDPPAGSLMSVLYDFVGQPVTALHYRYKNNTNLTNDVYATVNLDYDAHWLASVALLALMIFCLFRLGGALISKT